MLAAIILAAGESKRMGSPKALLFHHGQTFIGRITELYETLGIKPIVVVVGAHAHFIIQEIYNQDAMVIMNENYQEGQLSSILAGIDAVEGAGPDGIIVHPVDHPLVTVETIGALAGAFSAGEKKIVVPVHQGKRGHPVIFASSLFPELKRAKASVGAREVVWAHADDICEVEVPDAGILINIDTPEAYENPRPSL